MKRLIYAETSLEDLRQLFDYAAKNNLGVPDKIAEELMETCELIAQFPEMGQRREEAGARIREFVKGKYSIFYRNDEEVVRIQGFVHGSMDREQLQYQ